MNPEKILLQTKMVPVLYPAPNHTAIDIEQSDDGSIKLLSFVEAHQSTKIVKKKVNKLVVEIKP